MGRYRQIQCGEAVHFPQQAQHACLSTHAVEICSLWLAGWETNYSNHPSRPKNKKKKQKNLLIVTVAGFELSLSFGFGGVCFYLQIFYCSHLLASQGFMSALVIFSIHLTKTLGANSMMLPVRNSATGTLGCYCAFSLVSWPSGTSPDTPLDSSSWWILAQCLHILCTVVFFSLLI